MLWRLESSWCSLNSIFLDWPWSEISFSSKCVSLSVGIQTFILKWKIIWQRCWLQIQISTLYYKNMINEFYNTINNNYNESNIFFYQDSKYWELLYNMITWIMTIYNTIDNNYNESNNFIYYDWKYWELLNKTNVSK